METLRQHMFTETIPYDVITYIVARVASSSVADLCNLKQSCKMLYELGGENLVFKQVNMDKLPQIPWRLSKEAEFFLLRCQETGNPEALYRLGMVEYFSNVRLELGHAFLARAAYLGHREATYVLGIILVCSDTTSRDQGLQLLQMVDNYLKSKYVGFSECRIKSIRFLRHMWVNYYIRFEDQICCDSSCDKKERMPERIWIKEDYKDKEFACVACKYEHEVNLFCKMLRHSLY